MKAIYKILILFGVASLIACTENSEESQNSSQVTQFASKAKAIAASPSGQYCEKFVTVPPADRGHGKHPDINIDIDVECRRQAELQQQKGINIDINIVCKGTTKVVYEPAYLRGDINFDGVVDGNDGKASTIDYYERAFETACPAAFDVFGFPYHPKLDGALMTLDTHFLHRVESPYDVKFSIDKICQSQCFDVVDSMQLNYRQEN